MTTTGKINRKAWEHKVYEWRVESQGHPSELALKIKQNPRGYLRFHSEYFSDPCGERIASICGSDGKCAVALALLGAKPTIFDISEPQMRYAKELAAFAGVEIEYVLGDYNCVDVIKYDHCFDKLYCEGGILHYFHDLSLFYKNCSMILKQGGEFILSDFHPINKAFYSPAQTRNVEQTKGNYFDKEIHEGHVPYAKYFTKESQRDFPSCKLRFYTLEEIINSSIDAGFQILGFREHPKYNNDKMPGEFTLLLKNS